MGSNYEKIGESMLDYIVLALDYYVLTRLLFLPIYSVILEKEGSIRDGVLWILLFPLVGEIFVGISFVVLLVKRVLRLFMKGG